MSCCQPQGDEARTRSVNTCYIFLSHQYQLRIILQHMTKVSLRSGVHFFLFLSLPGFVNSILSWSPFVVLGRLTYMCYLIHPCILYVYFQNQERLYYITDTTLVSISSNLILVDCHTHTHVYGVDTFTCTLDVIHTKIKKINENI